MAIISFQADLTCRPQWLLWRYESREGKRAKVPCSAMGYRVNATNPQHGSEYGYLAELLRKRPGFADGLGFVFTPDDPSCGIDLDNCFPSDASECAPWAACILERFKDTYSELSPSGCGVKIWCRATAPRCGKWLIEAGAVAVYDGGRYFTVASNAGPAIPRVIADHQASR
jgi:putative DNA primase/helicase